MTTLTVDLPREIADRLVDLARSTTLPVATLGALAIEEGLDVIGRRKLERAGEAPPPGPAPVPPPLVVVAGGSPKLSAFEVKQCRSYRAGGYGAAEIARRTGLPLALVKKALAS